jgi:hypothetical protein
MVRVTVGLRDEEPTDWDGTAQVRDGTIERITGWRFDEKDKVLDGTSWKCRTRAYPLRRRGRNAARRGNPNDEPESPWPNGVNLEIRGAAPTVKIKFSKGDVEFAVNDLLFGEPRQFLDNQVRVQRLPQAGAIRPAAPLATENARQDDFPSVCIDSQSGTQYVAWITYQERSNRVCLTYRAGPQSPWSDPIEVAGPGDHFRAALAQSRAGIIWVVWSSQRSGNWDLYGRAFSHAKLGDEIRLTDAAGPDIWHRMITDREGRAWLVWQGFRDGQANIFARCADGADWHPAIQVSATTANNWDPVIAADPLQDRVWIGWDSYEGGNYQVYVRSASGGPLAHLGKVIPIAPSSSFQAHVNLACDNSGRLWAAWDESGPQWGKDSGLQFKDTGATRLYQKRRVSIRCLANDRWEDVSPPLSSVLPAEMQYAHELPQLQADTTGRMWLAFRHRTTKLERADGWSNQGRWDVFLTAFLGDRWLYPTELPDSSGRNDMRMASAMDTQDNVYFAYATDNRGWAPPPQMLPKNLNIMIAKANTKRTPVPVRFSAPASQTVNAKQEPAPKSVHPREKEQVAFIRHYSAEIGGKKLRIYRGDLHRHTDISMDGMGDGSLEDLYRYGLDAAALDYILVSDHNMGQDNEYTWWRTQQSNDLYFIAETFVPLYGYERSVPYPNGHRNVIWTERGHRTLPLPVAAIPKQMAEDTAKVYRYLQETGGICTSHSTATHQGTDWKQHDDSLEPFVELFQGFHASYEAPDAPKANTPEMIQIHGAFEPAGFVSNALGKGYWLGFQASSDHVSTHVSYACVWAESLTRKDLVAAMLKRHSYAATDNIVLDVRMGSSAMMGDRVRTAKPDLDIVVIGTGDIDRVDVLRNSAVVHAVVGQPSMEETRFHWEDPAPPKNEKTLYYYARVLQKNGHMAWSSPIWVELTD